MRKLSFTIFILFFTATVYSQDNLLKNEKLIFSFDTKSGKHVTIARDSNDQYIIYRFGSAGKTEMEFPGKTEKSWKDFTYAFYLRGGGIQNEGIDLNYVSFTNNGFKYVIYDEYYARGNQTGIGIRVTDLKTRKTIDIKGKYKTIKGTLVDLRDNKFIATSDGLTD
ncbi:hypothetical protein [Ferruginibacter sp.]